jgi:PIN domain nuclease of toxin-antitoxin system
MELLLDTHTFIWYINGDKKLSPKIKKAITDIQNNCFLSAASIWEMAIKYANGRLGLESDFNNIADFLDKNEISILPIEFPHVQELLKLEPHHRDPFDRIIIAQSISERLIIATKDEEFDNYKVDLLW